MSNATGKPLPSEAEMSNLTPAQWLEVLRSQAATIDSLQQRLAWFERQVFGSKSERLAVLENPQQLALGELLSGEKKKAASAKVRAVSAHTRRVHEDDVGVPNPHAQDLAPDQYEVIAQKVTYRLAQRPGSYVMLNTCAR
jgi:transposase